MRARTGVCRSRKDFGSLEVVFLKKFFAIFLFLTSSAFAQLEAVLKKGEAFFQWLNKNEAFFIQCKIEKSTEQIKLCDGTLVSYEELKTLFSLHSADLLKFIQAKGVEVDIICDTNKKTGDFKLSKCFDESSDNTFKKVTTLHGLYVDEAKKIFIRSSATKGTLIHEYLHFLQSKNTQKIDGHIYKQEKNDLKKEMNTQLDLLESEVKLAEKNKQPEVLKAKIAEFMKVNDLMLAFSKWQDLIDERSLFLLFVKYEKDFQIPKEDMDLVRKNLNFICKRKDYKSALPECSL